VAHKSGHADKKMNPSGKSNSFVGLTSQIQSLLPFAKMRGENWSKDTKEFKILVLSKIGNQLSRGAIGTIKLPERQINGSSYKGR
jgi:hypothetical protein